MVCYTPNILFIYIFVILLISKDTLAIPFIPRSLPFLPTTEGETVSNFISKHLGHTDNVGSRRPRNLSSILSLLWPQVVGPMHDGIIEEYNFHDIPKTSLENHLDVFRERARHDVATRQLIRDLITFGPDPNVQEPNPMIMMDHTSNSYLPPNYLVPGQFHLDAHQHRERRHHG